MKASRQTVLALTGVLAATAVSWAEAPPPVLSGLTSQSSATRSIVAGQITMDKRRAIILEQAARLKDFPGQQTPKATPQVLDQANQIVEGTVFFYERTPVKVGLKDIDWTGSHIKHQEWPAQLNRFFHLDPAGGGLPGDRRREVCEGSPGLH